MSSFILFMQAFSNGILAPVLSLTLLSKGVSMTGLSLMMGLFSLTAILLELPSGILADLVGRKKTLLMAQTATACSILLIFSGRQLFISAGMVLFGLGRALSSGTLDAFYIDRVSETAGMTKAVSRINLLDGAGLAAGAMIGGFLPVLSERMFAGGRTDQYGHSIKQAVIHFVALIADFTIRRVGKLIFWWHTPGRNLHMGSMVNRGCSGGSCRSCSWAG